MSVHFISFCFSLALESILKRLSRRSIHNSKDRSSRKLLFKVHCFALTMERLFSPCTRYRDILATQGRLGLPEELNLDTSTEELLRAERTFTYADLYAMLGNADTVAWLTPHASVARSGGRGEYFWSQLDESCRFYFLADGRQLGALARSPEYLLEICNVIFRLLAASVVHSVILHTIQIGDLLLVYGSTLLLWRI
jgi:hypothetical protein